MAKTILFNTEGRDKILKGVNTIADAVKVTLGANGKNVVIGRLGGYPHITKDGVTVARSISVSDEAENIGVSLMKEVANKTLEAVGDGTSTATVLTQGIVTEGVIAINNGYNQADLKKGMDEAVAKAVVEIKNMSYPVSDDDTLNNIATISANNDPVIGKLISDTMSKIGRDGIITVEESSSYATTVEITDGLKIDRGYLSPYFVTDSHKGICELSNPLILLYNKKIVALNDSLISLIEYAATNQRPILFIADSVEGEALATIVLNKMKGVIKVCAIKAPSFGDNRKDHMGDLAVLTGGIYIDEEVGETIEKATPAYLGQASKVIVTKDDCTIIGGAGSKELIAERCESIKSNIEVVESYQKDDYKARLAKLTNGVAVIKIGGVTETEIKEKKDRVDDAICATKAAIEEGYVAGGGTALLFAARNITTDSTNVGHKHGFSVIKTALLAPYLQILANSNIEKAKSLNHYGEGINVNDNTVINLFENGIIDPTKVVRVALQNAASIATIILTTECVISDNRE